MIRKIISFLTLTVMLFSIMPGALPAVASGSSDKPLSDVPYTYAVKPGDEGWNDMDIEEKFALCNISRETAEGMTTRALLLTMLDCPLTNDFYAFDTIEKGIEIVRAKLNGLDELLKREDAAEVLADYINAFSNKGVDPDSMEMGPYYTAVRLLNYKLEKDGYSPDYFVDPLTGWK